MKKIIATLHTSEHRGDHSSDVTAIFEVRPYETVEQLMERVIMQDTKYDWIELQFIV
jgi:hypothetical protein